MASIAFSANFTNSPLQIDSCHKGYWANEWESKIPKWVDFCLVASWIPSLLLKINIHTCVYDSPISQVHVRELPFSYARRTDLLCPQKKVSLPSLWGCRKLLISRFVKLMLMLINLLRTWSKLGYPRSLTRKSALKDKHVVESILETIHQVCVFTSRMGALSNPILTNNQ